MLYRSITERIEQFFEKEKKAALMVTGARQVGKTYCIREYAKRHFKYVIEINFLEMPQAVALFENATGSDDILMSATYQKLAQHPMIAGIKEANGDISSIVTTASLVGDSLSIYSGNDDQIVPILSMGGSGVISVLSNVLPRKTVEICTRFWSGDIIGSAALQCELLPLIHALFSEVNPIPVKAAMAALGFCENYLRLPLTTMEPEHREILLSCMRAQELSV